MIPGPIQIIGCPGCGAPHRRTTLLSGNTFGARQWSDGKVEAPMLPDLPAITRCAGCGRIFWVNEAPCLAEIEPFYIEPPVIGDVILTAVGVNRVPVMTALRRHLGTDLAGTKRLLDRVPLTIACDADERNTEQLRSDLTDVGALVEFVRSSPPAPPPPVIPEAFDQAPQACPLDAQGYREAVRQGLARTQEREILLRVRAWWCDNDYAREKGAAWIPILQRPTAVRENLEHLYMLLTTVPPHGASKERLLQAEVARQLGRFEDALAILEHRREETHQSVAETIALLAKRGEDALVPIVPSA